MILSAKTGMAAHTLENLTRMRMHTTRRPSNPSKVTSGCFTQFPWSWQCTELSIIPGVMLLKEDAVEGVGLPHQDDHSEEICSLPGLPVFSWLCTDEQSCSVASFYAQYSLSFPFSQLHQHCKKNVKRAKCFSSDPVSMYWNTECMYESPLSNLCPVFEVSKIKRELLIYLDMNERWNIRSLCRADTADCTNSNHAGARNTYVMASQ